MGRGVKIGCVAGGGTFRVLYFIGLSNFCFTESIVFKSCLETFTAAHSFCVGIDQEQCFQEFKEVFLESFEKVTQHGWRARPECLYKWEKARFYHRYNRCQPVPWKPVVFPQ